MRKVAMVTLRKDVFNDWGFKPDATIINAISEWSEVTEEQYNLLQRATKPPYYLIEFPVDQKAIFDNTIDNFLKKIERKEKEERETKERDQKERDRQKNAEQKRQEISRLREIEKIRTMLHEMGDKKWNHQELTNHMVDLGFSEQFIRKALIMCLCDKKIELDFDEKLFAAEAKAQ